MGKHVDRDKSDTGSREDETRHNPGWIGGILHVLDHHHLSDVKRILPHRRHRTRRPVICCTKPRTLSMERNIGEREPFLDTETGTVKVKQHPQRPFTERGEVKKPTDAAKAKRDQNYRDTSFTGSPERTKKLNKVFSHEKVKEYIDILEVFDVNKDLFVKILKDPDVAVSKQFYAKQIPKKLTKSGSFPLPGPSNVQHLRPATLEHKQIERWSTRRVESILVTLKIPEPKDDKSDSLKHEPVELANHGWFNHTVMNYMTEIKQKIRQALGVRKKKKKLASMDASDHSHRKNDSPRVKRTSSLNNSLDRYTQLLDRSFRQDSKFHSKSLKLNMEDRSGSKRQNLKFFRRISSLSDIDSLGLFLNELSRESFSSDTAVRKSSDHATSSVRVSVDKDKAEQSDIATEAESSKVPEEREKLDTSSFSDKLNDTRVEEDASSSPRNPCSDLAQTNSVSTLDSCSSDKITVGIVPLGSDHVGCPDYRGIPEDISVKAGVYANKDTQTQYFCCKIEEEYEHHFDYVRDVLELSGFLGDKDLGEWHSEDEPLSPYLFNELESRSQHEPEDETFSCCDHTILFALINEALFETHERSFFYFGRPFSFTRQICPMPKGQRVLGEVWSRASWHISSGSKVDQTLDDLVAWDLGKGDGWMNLQGESESMVFELEDLILDQLLNEVFC